MPKQAERIAQQLAAPTRQKTWRAPAKTRALRPAERPATSCDLEAMAVEAAGLLRLRRTLSGPAADAELLAALANQNEGPYRSEMAEALDDRLRAIEDRATHLRARSVKGALFQLYLAAELSAYPQGHLLTQLEKRDEEVLARNNRATSRLQYSALAHLETMVWDEDLAELRAWRLPRHSDIHAACELAAADRDALVVQAKARAYVPEEAA